MLSARLAIILKQLFFHKAYDIFGIGECFDELHSLIWLHNVTQDLAPFDKRKIEKRLTLVREDIEGEVDLVGFG